MRAIPILKAELKRELWVLFAALFIEFFICCGMTDSYFSDITRETAFTLSSNTDIFHTLEPMLACSLIWSILLVYIQFSREHLQFKQALPYTNRSLLAAKFVSWACIAVVSVLFYGAVVLYVLRKYDFLQKAAVWGSPVYDKLLTPGALVLNCITAFVFSMAVYSWCVMWNSVCKSALHGCIASFLGFADALLVMTLTDRVGFDAEIFTSLSFWITKHLGENFYRFTPSVMVLTVSLVTAAVFLPLCFILYGRDDNAHPHFYCRKAAAAVNIMITVFFACLIPSVMDMHGRTVFAGIIIGMVIGACTAALFGTVIKKISV